MKRMKLWLCSLITISLVACSKAPEQTVKVYAWQGESDKTTEQTLQADFSKWHAHGVNGMCYNAGHDLAKIQRAAKAAHANGMEYHAWIPAMLQHGLDSTLYGINRNGESAYRVQAYVPYYKCLCPNQPGTIEFLTKLYSDVADIPEVDYVHLDYIRYVDVILSRGLWEKYGLVMDEEYPTADYCYCDACVEDFKAKSESKTALDAYKELEALPDESALDFCIRMGWEDYVYQMLIVDYLILNRDRHGANIEVLRNSRKKTIRLAPLFDHGLSLLCSCPDDAAAAGFDVMADKPCNNFIGSKSTWDNLRIIPKDKMPKLTPLHESDRQILMEGLDGVLSQTLQDKIWEMIWKRWCAYEDFCHSR